jgi:hypothetical protein
VHTQNERAASAVLPLALDPAAQNVGGHPLRHPHTKCHQRRAQTRTRSCGMRVSFITAAGPPALPQQRRSGGSHHGAREEEVSVGASSPSVVLVSQSYSLPFVLLLASVCLLAYTSDRAGVGLSVRGVCWCRVGAGVPIAVLVGADAGVH